MQGDDIEAIEAEETPEQAAARRRKPWITLGAIALAVVLLLGIYIFFSRPEPPPASGATLSPGHIMEVMAPVVGRVQARILTGQTRDAGLAVTVGEGEMATTCHNLPTGALFAVYFRDGFSKAEVTRTDRTRDVCILGVKTTGSAVARLRTTDPAVGEKVYAAFVGAETGKGSLAEGHVTGTMLEPAGSVLQLDFAEPLATGMPIVDTQGRVVGIVTMPHRYGAGNVALSSARIAKVREAARLERK